MKPYLYEVVAPHVPLPRGVRLYLQEETYRKRVGLLRSVPGTTPGKDGQGWYVIHARDAYFWKGEQFGHVGPVGAVLGQKVKLLEKGTDPKPKPKGEEQEEDQHHGNGITRTRLVRKGVIEMVQQGQGPKGTIDGGLTSEMLADAEAATKAALLESAAASQKASEEAAAKAAADDDQGSQDGGSGTEGAEGGAEGTPEGSGDPGGSQEPGDGKKPRGGKKPKK